MNKNTVKRIERVVDNISNFDNVSAQELAELSFTSPSTISRFVRLQGYRNYIEYSVAIQNERKQKDKDVSMQIFDYWQNRLVSSFDLLEHGIQNAVDKIATHNIYVWCKREYDGIAKEFTFLISRSGHFAINIDENFAIENLVPAQDMILTIGEVPSNLYREDLEYVCITYSNAKLSSERDNIECLKIMPMKYHGYDTLSINYRVTCIQLLLGMICEQVCLITLPKEND